MLTVGNPFAMIIMHTRCVRYTEFLTARQNNVKKNNFSSTRETALAYFVQYDFVYKTFGSKEVRSRKPETPNHGSGNNGLRK